MGGDGGGSGQHERIKLMLCCQFQINSFCFLWLGTVETKMLCMVPAFTKLPSLWGEQNTENSDFFSAGSLYISSQKIKVTNSKFGK